MSPLRVRAVEGIGDVLDVCGHGVPAALLSVSVQLSLLRGADGLGLVRRRDDAGQVHPAAPADVANQLNKLFHIDEDAGKYFTMVYGVLDLTTGLFRHVCAGHAGPVILSGQSITVHDQPALPIGIMDDAEYVDSEFQLRRNDRMFMYSDGLNEARNVSNEYLGRTGLHNIMASCSETKIENQCTQIINAVLAWQGDGDPDDDLTLLGVSFHG